MNDDGVPMMAAIFPHTLIFGKNERRARERERGIKRTQVEEEVSKSLLSADVVGGRKI